MNNMYAFDLGTNNILNSDTKGDQKKKGKKGKERSGEMIELHRTYFSFKMQ